MSDETKAPDQRLLELRERQEAREKKREAEFNAGELEKLELIDKYETDLGARGREFEIVDLRDYGEGLIVVKRPSAVAYKQFGIAVDKAINTNRPVTEADYDAFVSSCLVHPDLSAYRAIAARRNGVPGECAFLAKRMHVLRKEVDAGK